MMLCVAPPDRAEDVVYRLLAAERRRGGRVIGKRQRQNIGGRSTISRWSCSAREGAPESRRVFRERNEPLVDVARERRTCVSTRRLAQSYRNTRQRKRCRGRMRNRRFARIIDRFSCGQWQPKKNGDDRERKGAKKRAGIQRIDEPMPGIWKRHCAECSYSQAPPLRLEQKGHPSGWPFLFDELDA